MYCFTLLKKKAKSTVPSASGRVAVLTSSNRLCARSAGSPNSRQIEPEATTPANSVTMSKRPSGSSASSRAWVASRMNPARPATALGLSGAMCALRISSYQGEASAGIGAIGFDDANGGGFPVLRLARR